MDITKKMEFVNEAFDILETIEREKKVVTQPEWKDAEDVVTAYGLWTGALWEVLDPLANYTWHRMQTLNYFMEILDVTNEKLDDYKFVCLPYLSLIFSKILIDTRSTLNGIAQTAQAEAEITASMDAEDLPS